MAASITTNPRTLMVALRALPTTTKKAATKELLFFGNKLRIELVKGIRTDTLGLRPLSPSTLEFDRVGKSPGEYPARSRRFRTQPLYRTGLYTDKIVFRIRHAPGAATRGVLGIEAGRSTYSQLPVAEIGRLHERGFRLKQVVTQRMLAFLHVALRRKGGSAAPRSTTGLKKGLTIVRFVEPRPAWARVLQGADTAFVPALARGLDFAFRTSGIRL
jgi:hypothetical protein